MKVRLVFALAAFLVLALLLLAFAARSAIAPSPRDMPATTTVAPQPPTFQPYPQGRVAL